MLSFVIIQQVKEKLQEENEVLLWKMSASVLYCLEVAVHLFTYFCVDSTKAFNPRRFKVYSTQMGYCVEQIMPETCVLE